MAAGTTIQHKRKAGAFVGGDLAAGEFGVDTTNGVVYFSTNGSTTVPVGPGSKTLARFTPRDNQPPTSNFATLDTRNTIAVLDYNDTTKETAVFVGVIPQGADLTSGLSISIFWMATTATSGDCRWEIELERGNTDLDSDSFDTAQVGTTTTNGTAGIPNKTTITLTTIDSVAVGEFFRLRVARDAANGGDTMAGDAELLAVEIQQIA